MNALIHDIRYAVRMLLKSPGFTAVALLTLGLGIGANTAIFSVVNGVLLRPLPYASAERIVMVWEHDRLRGTDKEGLSGPDFFDLRDRNRVFDALAGVRSRQVTLTRASGEPERVSIAAVSHSLLPLLGMRPLAGRGVTDAEDRPGGARVVLLSEPFWQLRFGGNLSAIGQPVAFDGETYTVIGIMPQAFQFPSEETNAWVPLQMAPTSAPRGNHGLAAVARLKAGVTLEAAKSDVRAIAAALEREFRSDNEGRGMHLVQLEDELVGEVRPALLILLGAVALVLLIACANVANLLLARAVAREREVAIRAALGASGGRLLRQFLTESVLLAVVAGTLGLVITFTALRALLTLLPEDLPRAGAVTIDAPVLAFSLIVSLLTGVVFGLVPALQWFRRDVQGTLKEGGRSGAAGSGRQRAQAALIVVEVALSVVLVIGAALLIQSFYKLQRVDPGFHATNVLKLELWLPSSRYPQSFANYPRWSEVVTFEQRLLDSLRELPGVRTAAIANSHPLDAGFTSRFQIEGRPAVPEGQQEEINIRSVSADYFRTVGTPILRGRELTDRDTAEAPLVTLINDAAVRRYFPNEDPIGRRMSFFGTPREIVGVVGNERFEGLGDETPPAVYTSYLQVPMGAVSVLVRTASDPTTLIPAVRRQVSVLDAQLAVFDVETLDAMLVESVAQPRFNTLLLGLFAALALTLALVGVHGVLSYSISQRRQEIGIRMALGAAPGDVLKLVLRQGLTLVAIGIAIGLPGAFALTRILSSLLYTVSPTDRATFAVVPVLLVIVASVASLLPARRAMKVDPMVALRTE